MRCERRHRSDCGHFGGHPRPEFMIQIAFICVIAAILIPGWVADYDKGKACVDLLARGGEGSCPVTGQAYPPGDVATCSDVHLPSSPRFPRAGGAPTQTLPALPPAAVDLKPSFFWRWIAAPILLIACVVIAGACALMAAVDFRQGLIPLLAAVAAGFGAWTCVQSSWTSERVEASKGRVVHRRWMAGVERAPRVFEDAKAVVPVKTRSGPIQAVLVHGRQATPLVLASPEDVARLDALLR